MAAQCDPLSGYLPQSDHGSNSERSADSPLPGSEEDLSGPQPPPDPEWTEERFRVDRKKLEIMLLAASEGRVNGGEDFFQKVLLRFCSAGGCVVPGSRRLQWEKPCLKDLFEEKKPEKREAWRQKAEGISTEGRALEADVAVRSQLLL